jgi:hypothetical protein
MLTISYRQNYPTPLLILNILNWWCATCYILDAMRTPITGAVEIKMAIYATAAVVIP